MSALMIPTQSVSLNSLLVPCIDLCGGHHGWRRNFLTSARHTIYRLDKVGRFDIFGIGLPSAVQAKDGVVAQELGDGLVADLLWEEGASAMFIF